MGAAEFSVFQVRPRGFKVQSSKFKVQARETSSRAPFYGGAPLHAGHGSRVTSRESYLCVGIGPMYVRTEPTRIQNGPC
jgi:hypothetical protein